MKTVEQFLSATDCAKWIARGEALGFADAKVGFEDGARAVAGIRNNERVEFADEEAASGLFHKAKPFLWEINGQQPSGCVPAIRIYRYSEGQRFKAHRDGGKVWQGKTSQATFMVYLNDSFAGGETCFETQEIKPKAGMALFFEHALRHEAKPVTSGYKYVLRLDVLYE